MISPVIAEKRGQAFDSLDVDRDGYLHRADFVALAERLACNAPTEQRAQIVQRAYLDYWDALAHMLRLPAGGRISRDAYVETIYTLISSEPDWFDDTVSYLPKALLALYDADGDGRLDRHEFLTMQQALGIDPDRAQIALLALDRDADGFVDGDDMLEAVREFVLSEDPHAPGNWFFGGITPPDPSRF